MRALLLTLTLLIALGALTGCGTTDDTADATQDATDDACAPGDAPFTIDDATISGKLLTVTVSYSGGCEEHTFAAWWSGATLTSQPPVVPLDLVHYGNGDACEAALTEDIVIDLSALDAVGSDEIRIDILPNPGSPSNGVEVLYTVPADAGDPAPAGALEIIEGCGTTP